MTDPKPALSTSGQEIAQPQKFVKIPVPIEAAQFLEGQPIPKGICFGWRCSSNYVMDGFSEKQPHVHTAHGNQRVFIEFGDWIVPEADGDHYYPIKPEVFAATYKPVYVTRAHSPAVQALESQPQDAKQWLAENFALNEKGQILTDYDAVEGNWLVDKTGKLWRVSEILEAYHAYSCRAESLSKSKAQEE